MTKNGRVFACPMLPYHTLIHCFFYIDLLRASKRDMVTIKGGGMNLEKLGLVIFLKYYKHFTEVKKHIIGSVREILLATSASIDLTNYITAENFILRRFQTVDNVLHLLSSMVKFSANQLEPALDHGPKDDFVKLKTEVVDSIIAAIDEEIEAVVDCPDTNKQLKIDALMTIRKVLLKQMHIETPSYDLNTIIDMDKVANG